MPQILNLEIRRRYKLVDAMEASNNSDSKHQTIYRCKKCQRIVASQDLLVSHERGGGQKCFEWKKRSGNPLELDKEPPECSSIFVEPMEWMESLLGRKMAVGRISKRGKKMQNRLSMSHQQNLFLLKTAMKKDCVKKEGIARRKVTWAPDVYDPPPLSDSHYPSDGNEWHGSEKNKKGWQKGGGGRVEVEKDEKKNGGGGAKGKADKYEKQGSGGGGGGDGDGDGDQGEGGRGIKVANTGIRS